MQRREFLQAAAAVAGVAAGDVPEAEIPSQQDRLFQLADHDDEERWEYDTACNLAHVRSGLLNAELDAMCEEPLGVVETLPVGRTASLSASRSAPTTTSLSGRWFTSLPSRLRRWQSISSNRPTQRGKKMNSARVTARIVRTEDGETFHEYEVGGVAYGSLDAQRAALNGR
ncbi:MAG: hypothetical protein V5A46_08965 [Haloferacaceae archaeon]